MITMQDALTANEFHYGTCTRTVGPRGGITVKSEVWRRNGMTKTWKRRPTLFRVPVKHGMYGYGYVDNYICDLMHTAADCPLNMTARDQHEHDVLVKALDLP